MIDAKRPNEVSVHQRLGLPSARGRLEGSKRRKLALILLQCASTEEDVRGIPTEDGDLLAISMMLYQSAHRKLNGTGN